MDLMTPVEMNVKKGTITIWKIVQSILIGIGGNLIFFMFLLTFLHVFEVVTFLPWIIAFNTALTGYSLIDKTRNLVESKRVMSATAGILTALMTCLGLTMFSTLVVGENLVTMQDWVLYAAIGGACSLLGAILAMKYHKL